MMAAADQAGVMCAVLHCMNWSPPLAAARDMLESGETARFLRGCTSLHCNQLQVTATQARLAASPLPSSPPPSTGDWRSSTYK
jgi:predicted dehydrogenase